MACTYSIMENEHLIQIDVDEQMTADELEAVVTSCISEAAYTEDHKTIIDTTRTMFVPPSGDVLYISRVFTRYRDVFAGKTAVITKGGLHREMMELVLMLIRANTDIPIRLFRDREAALTWLHE